MPYAEPAQYWYVVPLVGLVGASVAIYSVAANRAVARMRATLDLIERSESSDYYSEIRKSFRKINNAIILETIKFPMSDEDRKLRKEVLAYLNHYELVAIGCKSAILDEKFYAKWMKTTLIRDWVAAKELVNHIRNTDSKSIPDAYIQLERLAKRFQGNLEGETYVVKLRKHFFDNYYDPAHLESERLEALRQQELLNAANSPPTPATPDDLAPLP